MTHASKYMSQMKNKCSALSASVWRMLLVRPKPQPKLMDCCANGKAVALCASDAN